jgi:hypothetical protein
MGPRCNLVSYGTARLCKSARKTRRNADAYGYKSDDLLGLSNTGKTECLAQEYRVILRYRELGRVSRASVLNLSAVLKNSCCIQ